MMDDIETLFESGDGEFVIYLDGSWAAFQDGVRVHGSAFSKTDLHTIEEVIWPFNQSRFGLYDNDRIGEQ